MVPITHSNLTRLVNEHYDAVEQHLKRRRINKFNIINNWCVTNLSGLDLRDVITASPYDLDKIAQQRISVPVNQDILYLKDVYQRFSLAGESIGDNGHNATRLVEELNIRVCPYCNRSYINNVQMNKSKTQIRRTCQMDHYYSKDRYPFLAMSFFNLIPSCATCNHLKSNSLVGISPYHTYDVDEDIRFDFHIMNGKLTSEQSISISVKYATVFKANVDVFRLEDHYAFHVDVAYEVVRKKQIYPSSRIDELLQDFEDLFYDRDELIRTLFGNYVELNQLTNRPLAKLTRDIYRSMKTV